MTTACALAFGGNAAASEDYFQQAIAELAKAKTACDSFATVIRSSPMGAAAGSEFVNSAGVFQTHLSPSELLIVIHEIESRLGRQRSLHWGPRPIDIDVVFYGQKIIDTQTVVIPHPCQWYRSFVLRPLSEICPDWIHPIFDETVQQLNDRLNQRPLQIQIQNQHTDLPVLQIAHECWTKGDRQVAQLVAQVDSRDSFCSILVEPAEQDQRSQPHHESRRIIRCFVQPSDERESFRQFLMDLEAAVLG